MSLIVLKYYFDLKFVREINVFCCFILVYFVDLIYILMSIYDVLKIVLDIKNMVVSDYGFCF